MKKTTLIILIVAAALLMTGVICFVVAASFVDFNFVELMDTRTYELMEEEFDLEDGDDLVVNLNISELIVTQSPDDKVHLTYYEAEDIKYELKHENGELSMKYVKPNFSLYYIFSIGIYNRPTEISLPADFNGSITVKTETGGTKITGFDKLENVSIVSTTGYIELNEIIANNIYAKCSTGRITLESVAVNTDVTIISTTGNQRHSSLSCNTLNIKSSTGGLIMNNIKVVGDMICETSTGRQKYTDVICGSADFVASTGDILFESVDSSDIYMKASTGDIKGSLAGNSNDYKVISNSSTGSSNLPEDWGNGDRRLQVKTTTGEIKVTFND